ARPALGALRRRPPGEASRLDGERGGVLVIGGNGSGSFAATGTERLGDVGAVEAPERDVARSTDDSSHVGECTRGHRRNAQRSRPYSVARETRRYRERRRAVVRQTTRRRSSARGRADAG